MYEEVEETSRRTPRDLEVLVGPGFRHGSIVYATSLVMHNLDMGLCVTANNRDIKPKSMSTAQKKKKIPKI